MQIVIDLDKDTYQRIKDMELAKKNEYIKDKVAWASYLTWRQVEIIADSLRYKAETKEGDYID